MGIAHLVPLIVPALFLTFVAAERLWPARPLPTVRFWRLKGIFFFALSGFLSSTVPALYVDFIRAHRLMNLEGLGVAGGAVVGLLAVELVGYFWHRVRHRSGLLWRLTHQMHHSAERLDIFGATFLHPLDLVGTNLVLGVVTTMVLGLSVDAAAVVSILGIGCAMFQHTNLRTPRWLGYLVQRPESHSVHHARGIHAGNYSNMPVWDMLFGTFQNPARFEPETGFYQGASRRIGAMLVGRDVSSIRR
jgi:sterol desaturase/sphingolipid hydroxylase (fatty acid hydroxylase superfamily)